MTRIAEYAVVPGTGLGGLAAAAALAPQFDRVTIVEGDEMPHGATQRRWCPTGAAASMRCC